MIKTKYLIMIGAVVCLLISYYLYHEISNVKKSFVPTYQKTMALEARVLELEKKNIDSTPKRKINNAKIDSPALSITYQSDMAKNGNLSIMYADLSETEAKQLIKNIDQNKIKPHIQPQLQPQLQTQLDQNNFGKMFSSESKPNVSNQNKFTVPVGELSELCTQSEGKYKINKNGEIFAEETDTITVKVADIVKNKPVEMVNFEDNSKEYQQILNNFPTILSEEDALANDELDPDIIKSISETIKYADEPSDNISEIPSEKPNKKLVTALKKNKKNIKKVANIGNKKKQIGKNANKKN